MCPQIKGCDKPFTAPVTPVPVVVCVDRGDVPPHVRLDREPCRAEGAGVGSLTRMSPHVVGEVSPSDKPGCAHLAPVRPDAIVSLHVFGIIRRLAKRGATLFALSDLLARVDKPVSHQVTTLCERLPARVTLVWLLTSVYQVVTGHVTRLGERLAADIAPVWPLSRVRPAMVCEMACLVGGVLAPLTLVSAVPADVAVTPLHVSVQTILSQTRVVAVRTVDVGAATWGEQTCTTL